MKSATAVLLLVLGCCVGVGQSAIPTPGEPDPSAFNGVRASLQAGRKDEALAEAKAIVAKWPDDAHANVITGYVLLEMRRPQEALTYLQKAESMDPGDPQVHLWLLQAYAEMGDRAHRNEEIALLRQYHSDGRHLEFAKDPGMLIEEIPVGSETIDAVEYFEPVGRYHFYYRFDVYDKAGKLEKFIALASEDEDQYFYQQAHPKEAKAGGRRYSLDEYTDNSQALLGFIDGAPAYDTLRARIVTQITDEQSAPPAPTSKR